MTTAADKAKIKVVVLRMAFGAIIGAAVTGGFLAAFGDALKAADDPGVMLAIMAGLIYLLTGLMVWLGVAVPSAGAHYLNVEDADELREETPKLKSGVAVMVLTGAFLLVLAMASGGLIERPIAVALALSCLAGIALFGWLGAKRYDEMTKRLGQESAMITVQVGMLGLAVWATLAALGYVAWVGPLALVSGFALLQLFASFIVIGKRGMLMPR